MFTTNTQMQGLNGRLEAPSDQSVIVSDILHNAILEDLYAFPALHVLDQTENAVWLCILYF